MSRARLAALTLATGIGLVSGCSTISNCPLFGRCSRGCAPACAGCEVGDFGEAGAPIEGVPILDGYVPPAAAPGVPVVPGPVPAPGALVPGPVPTPGVVPQSPLPLTTPPDRLVPMPAQPEPYQPSGRGFQHGV
jgi:hypothetical protein